jgi:hypothetical protein
MPRVLLIFQGGARFLDFAPVDEGGQHWEPAEDMLGRRRWSRNKRGREFGQVD